MGHHCIYEDRLEVENGKLVRIINARWGGKTVKPGNLDVFKHYEDGKTLCRNLYWNYIGGYSVETDVKPEKWDVPWLDCKAFTETYSFPMTGDDAETIKSRYPGFRWMLDKLLAAHPDMTKARAFQFLNAWKLWPECERLLSGGYENLCLSASFAKAPYLKQKEMFTYLQNHAEIADTGFAELQYLMKHGISQEKYRLCKKFKTGVETIDYYFKQLKKRKWSDGMEDVHGTYSDYIHIGLDNGHDMEDPYWKWPNDLKKAHDKVVKEADAIRKAKAMEKENAYRHAVEKYIGKEIKAGNITVHVAPSIDEWDRQAKALNQCIMYGGYMDDMMAGKCLLLFVLCDGEPMATAEIDRKGKIVQFYADQQSDDMTPTPEADAAVKQWLKTYKPKFKEAA